MQSLTGQELHLTKEDEAELRLIMAELEHRRRVNPLLFYKPLLQQGKFSVDSNRVKAIFGGNRAGKTEPTAEYIIEKCLAKPKQRWWACAETFPDSVNIQQRKIWDLMPKLEIKYGYWNEINGFPNRKLLFKNGSMIVFKSYDQGVESFASDDCDGIWFDEEPPLEIVKESRMRLLDRNGEMVFSMTSVKGVTELISEIFEEYEIIESRFAPHVNETLPVIAEKNGIRFYFLWTTDNPHIDQNRVKEEIKLMSRDEIKSRIYGIPINLQGRIYPQFNRKVHVIPFEDAPTENVVLYHILDPHDRKPWAMQWIIMDKTNTAYCVDEYPGRDFNEILSDDKTYDDYASIIRQKEDALFDIYKVGVNKRIIDPNFGNKGIRLAERTDERAHTTIKEELSRRGFKFQDGVDNLQDGHLKVREKLHYETKDGQFVKQPAFFVTENSINTIKHLSRYSHKDINATNGDIKDKVGVQEKYKDFCDCVRYFWMSRPIYYTELKEFVVENKKVY